MSELNVCVTSGLAIMPPNRTSMGGWRQAEAIVYAPHGRVVARFIVNASARQSEAELRDRARGRANAWIAADDAERHILQRAESQSSVWRAKLWRRRGL